jgi:hypothetical protein
MLTKSYSSSLHLAIAAAFTRRSIGFGLFCLLMLTTSHVYTADHRSEQHSAILAPKGTLVVALATKDGLVVCADKRTYDWMRGDLDNEVKIRNLGTATLISSTGLVKFYDILTNRVNGQQSLRLGFDANAVATEYFETHGFDNSESFWKGFTEYLSSAFQAYIGARPFAHWPETGDPPDNALFQLAIFFLDALKQPDAVYVRFGYIKSNPPPISVSYFRESANIFQEVKPVVLGSVTVWKELETGRDERFNDIRTETQLMRFVRDRPLVNTVTIQAGLTFARRLITVTSQRTQLIENTNSHVGTTNDCALLSKHDGFQWQVY